MKKITLVTQFFPPDYAATGQLLDRLTNQLSSSKIKFRIICGMPYYAYKKTNVTRFEINKNRLIIRTRLSALFNKKIFGRIINSLLFVMNIIYNLIFIYPKSELIIFTTEPPFSPFISILTFFIKKTKYILIIYDLYPNILIENNLISKDNILIRIWSFFNKYVYLNAEKIILLSSPMAKKFVKEFPFTKKKISIIPSWSNVKKIKPLSKNKNWFVKQHKLNDKFVILYSGNQGRCHDFQTILDTALLLENYPKFVFLFIGNGYKNNLIREFKISHNLKNIKLLDYQDFDNLPYSLTSADLALVSVNDKSANLVAPSKLYGHLAAGSPIGIISPANSYLEELIDSNNLGRSFRNGESNKLKDWIIQIYKDEELKEAYSKNSRKFIIENYTEEIITKKYLDLINDVLSLD